MIRQFLECLDGMNGLHLAVVAIIFLGGLMLASSGFIKHR